jgi:hypothetical protein
MRILDERDSRAIENKEHFATRETAEWVIYTDCTVRSVMAPSTLQYVKN